MRCASSVTHVARRAARGARGGGGQCARYCDQGPEFVHPTQLGHARRPTSSRAPYTFITVRALNPTLQNFYENVFRKN